MCDPGGVRAERVGPSCSGVVAELLLVRAPAAATAPQLERALSVTGLSWFLSWSSWFLDTSVSHWRYFSQSSLPGTVGLCWRGLFSLQTEEVKTSNTFWLALSKQPQKLQRKCRQSLHCLQPAFCAAAAPVSRVDGLLL